MKFVDLNYKQFKITDIARCLTTRYIAASTNHACENSGVLISTEASVDNDEPKIIDAYNRRVLKDGIVGTLTANGNTSIGHCGTFLVADYNDSNIQTDSNSPKVIGGQNIRIRRLTPKECWRLQGFPDEYFDKAKAAGISDSQLFKMAGNAVSVPVAKAIGLRLMEIEK